MSFDSRSFNSPLSVHLLREGLLESVHYCQAIVADERGRPLTGAGSPTTEVFARSSLKPFQAMAVLSAGIRERYHLSERDLAILCGSHQGTMTHARQVFGMLWRADLEPEHLTCPIPVGKPSALCHNCSGKHAGMLMACRTQNWSLHDYANRHHPVQVLIRSQLADLLHMPADEFLSARDDCGVPTYQLQLGQMASLYAQLTAGYRPELESLTRSMTHHPDMVAGSGHFDTELMRFTQGDLVSKSGAEGIQCIGRVGEGLGLAIKVADGASRAKYALAIHLLRQMGWISPSAAESLSERFVQLGSYTRLEVQGELPMS
ncbi:MAG: asparaginase [Cyanobacteriota bacterium]|nr:asparaginase [Cyanobacteriota bacterium]